MRVFLGWGQILVAIDCKLKNNISRDQGKNIGWRNGSIKSKKKKTPYT